VQLRSLRALPLAVGFALAEVAGFGDLFEGVFFREAGVDEGGDFVGEGFLCGLRVGSGEGAVEEKDDLAADGGALLKRGEDFGDGAAKELFVELGELACEDDAVRGAERGGDVFEGFEDAVRGFVEDVRGGRVVCGRGGDFVAELFESGAALAGL